MSLERKPGRPVKHRLTVEWVSERLKAGRTHKEILAEYNVRPSPIDIGFALTPPSAAGERQQ